MTQSHLHKPGVGVDGGQSQLRLRVDGLDDVIIVPGVSHGQDVGARVRDAIVEAATASGITSYGRLVAGLTALPVTQSDIDLLAADVAHAVSADEVIIVDDTVTAHSAAFGGASGIALVVGTGVACLAVDAASGRIHRTSGSGYLLGDEGGAFWIGRHGLARAVKSHDGRGASTMLLAAATKRFDVEAADLAVRVHVDDRAVSAIAAFAVDVTSAAAQGDAIALQILEHAADELAACVHSCSSVLPGSAAGGVALMGRLITGSELFVSLVIRAIAQINPEIDVRVEERSPLDGALALATSDDVAVYRSAIIAHSTPSTRPPHSRPSGSAALAYLTAAHATLSEASKDEIETVSRAADHIASSLKAGGMVHTFGTGHSHMLAEELFYRAGGLARVDPILIGELMLHESASRSTEIERQPGLADTILRDHPMSAGDVLIIASNSGGNCVAVELALRAREIGVFVIALTSLRHATSAQARTGTGARLHDVADLTLDNHGVVGDAAVSIGGSDRRVGATSTVVGAALLQAMAVEVVALLVEQGVDPEVFASSNTAGGDEINRVLLDRYRDRVRSL